MHEATAIMDELFATNTGPPATAGDGAFERFLTAAIAAIITIMFSWRLLATEENLGSGEGAVGGAPVPVGREVPKVVMKKAIKMAKAAGYTEESKQLEKARGLCDEGKKDDIGGSDTGINTVTSPDPHSESLITCWEERPRLNDDEERLLESTELKGLSTEADMNQGVNGFSRGNPEYRDILDDDRYRPFDGGVEFGDDIEPRELDSDEDMYCGTMLETIMEEDSDDMCSTSTGSDADSLGRTGEFGYFELNAEGDHEGDYTEEGGCTVHVVDDGSELSTNVITISSGASWPDNDEFGDTVSYEETAVDSFSEGADDSYDAQRKTAQLPGDTADDSNSDGSDESVITVVTRQLSEEKESPLNSQEFTFTNTGQIEIVPVRTRATSQVLNVAPVSVQSTFQALQPDEPYPTDDQHSPALGSGIDEGLQSEKHAETTDIPSPSLDSGVYSIETRTDDDKVRGSLEGIDELEEKFDINSNVDTRDKSAKESENDSASRNASRVLKIETVNRESAGSDSSVDESGRRLDIVYGDASGGDDVPDYKDAYVSSAVEKTPKGFIFSRFELETTDYEEKVYTTDRATHTVVAKLVAEERFVPTEQTDDKIRKQFSNLEDGDKIKTSPQTFAKAGTSKETNVDEIFEPVSESRPLILRPGSPEKKRTHLATEHRQANIDDPVGVAERLQRHQRETDIDDHDVRYEDTNGVTKHMLSMTGAAAPPEKLLRMDKTDGSRSHRIVPVTKELSVADRLMKVDGGILRETNIGDTPSLTKRVSSVSQGESPPEKVLKIGISKSLETLIDDKVPSTTPSGTDGGQGQLGTEKTLTFITESRETLTDSRHSSESTMPSKQSQVTSNEEDRPQAQSRETLIDDPNSYTGQSTGNRNSSVNVPQVHTIHRSRETLIDDVVSPVAEELKTDRLPKRVVDTYKETLIDDAPVVKVPTWSQDRTERTDTPRRSWETMVDDVGITSSAHVIKSAQMEVKSPVYRSRETLIDDVLPPQIEERLAKAESRESLIDEIDMVLSGRTDYRMKTVAGVQHDMPLDDIPPTQEAWKPSQDNVGMGLYTLDGRRETLIDDPAVPSEGLRKASSLKTGSFIHISGARETLIDNKRFTSTEHMLGRAGLTDETDGTLNIGTPGIYETNIDDVSEIVLPERILNIDQENVKLFRNRASLNRDGSSDGLDESNGNELDKSFGDVTNRSEDMLGEVSPEKKNNVPETDIDAVEDEDEDEWVVDEVVQDFTIMTGPEGQRSFIPGKMEHRIIHVPPEHKPSMPETSQSSSGQSAETSPQNVQTQESQRSKETEISVEPIPADRPTPKPRRSLRSEDGLAEPQAGAGHPTPTITTQVSPDGKLHLDAIDEVSWKPLSDSIKAEKSPAAVRKLVMEDVIISGSHLIPRPRRQVYSEADKSNPLVAMNSGDMGSYGTRSNLAHLSTDIESEVDIDFEMFAGGVGDADGVDSAIRPVSESSPKHEGEQAVADGNESPDDSGFPSPDVSRKILEQFKRSKSVEHLQRKSWGMVEDETVFMPTQPVKPDSPVMSSPVLSPPIIPDSPVVTPPSMSFLVSKKGSKSVPNLAGIDDSPTINAPMSHTRGSAAIVESPTVQMTPKAGASPLTKKPSRYTKKYSTTASSPVIKAAAKAKAESQQTTRQVTHTDIDDVVDGAAVSETSQLSTVGPKSVSVEKKYPDETTFSAGVESSPVISPSPMISPSPVSLLPASPVIKQAPAIVQSPTVQLHKTDTRSPLFQQIDRSSVVTPSKPVEAAPVISASPKIESPVIISSPSVKMTKDVRSSPAVQASPLIEESPSIPMSPTIKASERLDASPFIEESPSIPMSPTIKASEFIDASPSISFPTHSSAIPQSPTLASPLIPDSPVIPTSPTILQSPSLSAPPTILASPTVSIPISPTVSMTGPPSLEDTSLEDQSSFGSQKRYRSLKEIKRKFSSKNFKSMHMPPTPNIGQFVVPPRSVLTTRNKINAYRKRFLSEGNLLDDSESQLNDQFNEHKESLTTKYKSPRRPGQKTPSSYRSQDNLERFTLAYPNFFWDDSSDGKPSIDELHKNCIFSPEGRKDILNKTLSIENLSLDLGAHLRRYGSVTSLYETDIDTGETSETIPFPETDLDLWFSLQHPIERAVSMTDLRSERSYRTGTGKGRFAHRNVPKSKSLQTLETNLDDEEDELKRVPSVHELRVTKSLSKLNIPDWFKNSSLSKSSSCMLRHGSTSTMSSWGYNPSLTSSPCPSVTPTGNVVIKTRVSPSSSMRLFKSPKFASVPTLPKTPEERQPKAPVKLPSERLRKSDKPKGLEKIPIVPFAQIRAMFEAKAANERARKKDSAVRQDSVSSKLSAKAASPVPVVTVSPSEIVILESSPKRPRSPPVIPPEQARISYAPMPQQGPSTNAGDTSQPWRRPLSPSTVSPQRPLSPTETTIPQRTTSPLGSAGSHRSTSPAVSTSPQRPLSPAESSSPRSISPLGSLSGPEDANRSFSPSDRMRPINPDGPHNRSMSSTGSMSPPRSISPGGILSPRGYSAYTGQEQPASPESPPQSPVEKTAPRGILGPTVRFVETEKIEVKDNKPAKPSGKKTDFFKRLQVFQRPDKDKKNNKAEDPQKQVPASKLKSAFEPFSRNSKSIETAPSIQAPNSQAPPKSPTRTEAETKLVEEAPVLQAPNSKSIESAPTLKAPSRTAPEPTGNSSENFSNDRNSHSRQEPRNGATSHDPPAGPVRVGNSGQSLTTPVLTPTPFSRTSSTSEAQKRSMKGEVLFSIHFRRTDKVVVRW